MRENGSSVTTADSPSSQRRQKNLATKNNLEHRQNPAMYTDIY
jgi:hypothetical protein